jgi:YidC/Oxa1 family membrane protein insertase
VSELWNALLDGMGSILAFFYSGIPSYGVAIIGLTVLVRLVLFPLTAKQARSQMKMTQAAPEIKKIQQQYKDDRQKQNEALMAFYKENNVNPLAGCLPLIIQMPVLFALFQVLRDIQKHIPTTGAFNDLFRDLCGSATTAAACTNPKDMYFLGINLMVSPQDSGSVTSGIIEQLPYYLAVALVVATGWYQLWQTQLRQKRSGVNQNNPMNRQMQMISRVFPIFFGFFAYVASSGLVLYFVTSSLWRIGQQHLVLNKYYEEHPDAAKKPGGGTKKPLGGGKEKELPPSKPAPPAPRGGANGGAQDNGADRRAQPSPHTSRKKRKRRR